MSTRGAFIVVKIPRAEAASSMRFTYNGRAMLRLVGVGAIEFADRGR